MPDECKFFVKICNKKKIFLTNLHVLSSQLRKSYKVKGKLFNSVIQNHVTYTNQ